MFSEGVNLQNNELRNVKIIEKQESKRDLRKFDGTRPAIRIVSGFKKVLGEQQVKTKLRIVNLEPLAGRKFPKDFADGALISNMPRDIIYLPEIQAPASKEVLNSIFELRNKYVCITAAKRECNEVSAAECIAIGVREHSDYMILSGVLDFVLDSAECEDCHGLDDGVPMAIGIIAGLLQKLYDCKGIFKSFKPTFQKHART